MEEMLFPREEHLREAGRFVSPFLLIASGTRALLFICTVSLLNAGTGIVCEFNRLTCGLPAS